MSMWWLKKGGREQGPMSEDEIKRRIPLNLVSSLDRISSDRRQWRYVRDTPFWSQERTLPEEVELPKIPPRKIVKAAPSKTRLSCSENPSKTVEIPMDECHQQLSMHDGEKGRAPTAFIPTRLRMKADVSESMSSSRKIWWVVGCIAGAFLLLAMTFVGNYVHSLRQKIVNSSVSSPAQSQPRNDGTRAVGFEKVKDKLAIIECKEGVGTGFLVEMDDKTYLMSNEHVVRSASLLSAKRLDGTPLKLGEFSVAADRDLARFEIDDTAVNASGIPRFKIRAEIPNTGEQVAVYGNSDGAGVVTESKGFIQGVGPYRLETNAEIVHGNSGSPLVDSGGEVIGVATFLRNMATSDEDWTLKNTRYDGSVRRFAVRFTDVKWTSVERGSYEEQVRDLTEFKDYWDFLVPFLLFDSVDVSDEKLVYNELCSKVFPGDRLGFDEMLRAVEKSYGHYKKTIVGWDDRIKGRNTFIKRLQESNIKQEDGKRYLREYDDKTAEKYAKMKSAWRDMAAKRKEALAFARDFLSGRTWVAPQIMNGYGNDDRRESVSWYLQGVKWFDDVMTQKQRDMNKSFEQLEKGDEDEE